MTGQIEFKTKLIKFLLSRGVYHCLPVSNQYITAKNWSSSSSSSSYSLQGFSAHDLFQSINSREVFWGIVLGLVSHMVDIS
jgi:hypothetical protein